MSAPTADRARQLFDMIAVTPPDHLPRRSSHLTSDIPALLAAVATSPATDRARRLRDTIATVAAWAGRVGAAEPRQPDDPAADLRPLPASPAPPAPEPGPRPPHTGRVSAAEPPQPDDPAADLRPRPASPAPPEAGPRPPHTGAAVRAATAVDVASALPFLLLGPLAQTGYLAALVPALRAVGLERRPRSSPPRLPTRCWARWSAAGGASPDDIAAAAVFAGLDTPMPGPALAEFARVAAPTLPALDAVVTRTLAEGHTAGEPLALAGLEDRDGGGLLLVDREGSFPVAWTGTVGGLLPAWRMCGSPPVLVAPDRSRRAARAGRRRRPVRRREPARPGRTLAAAAAAPAVDQRPQRPGAGPVRGRLPAGSRADRRARPSLSRGPCRGTTGRRPGAGPQPAAGRRTRARHPRLDAVAGARADRPAAGSGTFRRPQCPGQLRAAPGTGAAAARPPPRRPVRARPARRRARRALAGWPRRRVLGRVTWRPHWQSGTC